MVKGIFLLLFLSRQSCLQNFPLPFRTTGQAQLHEHNKDEFPGLNTICNKVPLPEQEMQREGFSATWQIRARKPCQSKHHYWEGSARAQMRAGRVSCPGRRRSRYRYARTGVQLLTQCWATIPSLGQVQELLPRLLPALLEGLSFSKTCLGEIFFFPPQSMPGSWKPKLLHLKKRDFFPLAHQRNLRKWGYCDSVR